MPAEGARDQAGEGGVASTPRLVEPGQAAPSGAGELGARIASSAVLAPTILWVTWMEAPIFVGAVAAAGVILAREWTRMSDPEASDLSFALAAGGAAGATIAASAGMMATALAVACGAALAASAAAWTRGRAVWAGFGVLYCAAPCVAIVWLRLQGDPAGSALVTFLLLTVWGADIGAYAAGRAIGGARIAPRISPQKTWAGVAGGVVLAVAFGAGAAAATGRPAPIGAAAAGAAALALAALAGDLLESGIKRRFGVKDAGALIPGHGGLLDRVDGLMAAACALAVWTLAAGASGT